VIWKLNILILALFFIQKEFEKVKTQENQSEIWIEAQDR
jgi:hypothetical protein